MGQLNHVSWYKHPYYGTSPYQLIPVTLPIPNLNCHREVGTRLETQMRIYLAALQGLLSIKDCLVLSLT